MIDRIVSNESNIVIIVMVFVDMAKISVYTDPEQTTTSLGAKRKRTA